MTIREISTQLHSLSVGGYFNREKFTRQQLHGYITGMFREGVKLAIRNTLVMEIALPDGWWYFTITRWGDGPDGYDYYIPDKREDSDRIYKLLTSSAKAGA